MIIETDSIIANLNQEDIKYIWNQSELTQKYECIRVIFLLQWEENYN